MVVNGERTIAHRGKLTGQFLTGAMRRVCLSLLGLALARICPKGTGPVEAVAVNDSSEVTEGCRERRSSEARAMMLDQVPLPVRSRGDVPAGMKGGRLGEKLVKGVGISAVHGVLQRCIVRCRPVFLLLRRCQCWLEGVAGL